MSSFTFADHKMGGRLQAAVDAIGAGHLNRAAGIFAEIADTLNQEATEAGLLAEDVEEIAPDPVVQPEPPAHVQTSFPEPADLRMCSRNVHNYGQPDSNGWRHCQICGVVNVSPPDNQGFVDMGARR